LAAFQGHTETVKALLEGGADVDIAAERGKTALMKACDRGHIAIAQLLVENGADVNGRDDSGATALMWAAHRGCAGAVKLLIDAGAELNHQNLGGGETVEKCWFTGVKLNSFEEHNSVILSLGFAK